MMRGEKEGEEEERKIGSSGGATPGRPRSNDLDGRSTALAQALAPPCLALHIALLR